MPDLHRKTVSATEIAALFNESPYLTRWMLFQRFANGVDLSVPENDRMAWGTLMQPLVAEAAARELNLVVEQNAGDCYVARGVLGCSRDAQIIHPERGLGALEVKCIFDYKTWMDRWHGGDFVPREYELQLQQQMFVGNGHEPFTWGLLVAWVCAKLYYFERTPQVALWREMETAATGFLADVAARREPDPTGAIIELPLLAQLYPTVEQKILDLREVDGADTLTDKVRTFLSSRATATAHTKVSDSLRAEFIGLAKDAETILLPNGARVTVSTDRRGARRVDAWMPEEAK